MILQISCSICFNKNIYLQACSYTIGKLISNKFQLIQFSYKSITLTYIHPWNKSYKDYDQQKHVSHITLQNKKHAPKLSLEAGLAFQGFVVFSEIMVEVALKVGCTPFIGPPGAPQADRKTIPQKKSDTNPTGRSATLSQINWVMKKIPSCLGLYRGWNPTQLYRDYFINHIIFVAQLLFFLSSLPWSSKVSFLCHAVAPITLTCLATSRSRGQ